MLTSVVIATYCGEKFIEEQLQTLFKQTYIPDEVIISDDVSKDKTVEIVKSFIEKNNLSDKWTVKVNSKNKGYAKNFLEAAYSAKGDIVFFCDQDDLWEEDKIESMIKAMQSDKDIHVLASNLKPFTYESNTRKWDKKRLEEMKINTENIEKIIFNNENFHLKRSGCTMCIRKKFLDSIMPYWQEGWAHDDFVWKMAGASDGLGILQKLTVNRRMHENNATVIRTRNQEWRLDQLNKLRNQLESFLLYLQEEKFKNNTEKIKVIQKNIKALDLRTGLIDNKRIFNWIILACKYRDCYPRIKGLYLDLFLTILKEYKGV